jgi:LmbE family N-acetylglucosaminyl deacetylase
LEHLTGLPAASSVLAVVAHPDDESFGLGAVLAQFARTCARVQVLCFTHGEASTLGPSCEDLAARRAAELAAAGRELGLCGVKLLDEPDGHLAEVPFGRLVEAVERAVAEARADLIVVFDEGGVSGHSDHARATEAALAGTAKLPVLAWSIEASVASQLNACLATSFLGRTKAELDIEVLVDRACQLRAVACHKSQSLDNPVLWQRLALQGEREWLRWLRRPDPAQDGAFRLS